MSDRRKAGATLLRSAASQTDPGNLGVPVYKSSPPLKAALNAARKFNPGDRCRQRGIGTADAVHNAPETAVRPVPTIVRGQPTIRATLAQAAIDAAGIAQNLMKFFRTCIVGLLACETLAISGRNSA